MKVEILEFESEQLLARAAAGYLVDRVGECKMMTLALSGGRISVPLFRWITQGARDGGVSFDRVHIFWADERCVGAMDPESNYRGAQVELLRPLGLLGERVHRIRGEDDPWVAARQAEEELLRHTRRDGIGRAVLDLVILGMGEDGHVASLFPGAGADVLDAPGSYVAVEGPKPPFRRVSLTYGALGAAQDLWVLVAGAGKAEALRGALAGDHRIPLGRVLASRAGSRVFRLADSLGQ